MDRFFNTKTMSIGCKNYCVYCGEEAKNFYEYLDHYDRYDYWNCDCDGAKAERELCEFHKKLFPRLKENTKKLNEIKFDLELSQLKHKYNIK